MDDRAARRSGYALTIPDVLLDSDAMRQACAARNFQEIFRLVNRRTGSSHAVMAAAVGKMTSSRVSDIIRGVRGIRGREVIERVADGFGIPGEMLGLPARPWESSGDSAQSDVALPVSVPQFDRGKRVIQALEVMNNDSAGALPVVLGELIDHYALAIYSMPLTDVYEELLTVRNYASTFLGASLPAGHRKEITLSIGWLSCLLGVAACDMGSHAAAHVWCSDAERRSQEVGHPELSGWAVLTKSLIAFYQGRPHQSVALAGQGQSITASGTLVHAKLATQEMRAAAMAGDAARTETARRYASKEMAGLPHDVALVGAFSMSPGEDPPYTATSLMLLGRHHEAVTATNRVLETLYRPGARQRGEHPSSHARALLILGLAQAGAGNLDEAVSAGHDALAGSRPAWPTVTLAGKLSRVLERRFPKAVLVEEYRCRYLEVVGQPIGNTV
ncbi:XRE family transcriptional regulator [Streptomyces sp. CSDS2]|uniref:XRE family transcriptional regulator n=1 Tax=Streptomyces sp. CSDS2 TaxID=3055051 RepID=UPI0025AFD7E4|nr:XRE family transcriptional regulator [Streptomyces sp. CSDS2]MDN3264372.1 XRE family transcriptional regulator [Streptomyces sp. CSDS2]